MWYFIMPTLLIILVILKFMLLYVDELESRNHAVEMQFRSSAIYDDALKQRADEIRRFNHDAKGLLQAVEYALGEKRDGLNSARIELHGKLYEPSIFDADLDDKDAWVQHPDGWCDLAAGGGCSVAACHSSLEECPVCCG